MALTLPQRATLAAHIRASADAEVITALAGRNDTEMARLYNLDSGITIWKSSVSPAEYRAAIDWTEVDNLTIGKARIWEWVTQDMSVAFDATNANIRAGLAQAWVTNSETRTNLLNVAKRLATVAEGVFANGEGAGTPADPDTASWTGNLTHTDVGKALNENP